MPKSSSKQRLLPYLPWSIEDLLPRNNMRITQAENLLDAITMLDEGNLPLCIVLQSSDIENLVNLWPDSFEIAKHLIQENKLLVGPWYTYPFVPLVSSEALIRNLLIGSKYSGSNEQSVTYIGAENMVQQLPQLLVESGIRTILSEWNESESLSMGLPSDSTIVAVMNVQVVPFDNSRQYQAKQVLNPEMINRSYHKNNLAVFSKNKDILNFSSSTISYSSRMPVKLENFEAEVLLSHWAEPFSAWAVYHSPTGSISTIPRYLREPQAIIEQAWKTLLLNHSYYSALGTVSDQVQNEMMVRVAQSKQLGQMLKHASMKFLTQQIDTRGPENNLEAQPIVIFNGASEKQTGLVFLDSKYLNDGIEIVDANGKISPISSWEFDVADQSLACFVAVDVPQYGYKTYWVRPSGAASIDTDRDTGNVIENEFISLSVDPGDGTFSIFDKQTGRLFEDLNQFVDDGDSGTLHQYVKPIQNTLIDVATNTPLSFERIRTPSYEAIRYLLILRVPLQMTEKKDARLPLAAQFVPISISVTLTLAHGVPRVDVKTDISNNALDHRLRVFFPFGGRASVIELDDIFAIQEYLLPQSNLTTNTDPHEYLFPQRTLTTIRGSDTGLTIANRGISEIGLLDRHSEHALALTLLRCVSDFHSENKEFNGHLGRHSAQCLGEVTLSYSLIPHGTEVKEGRKEARCFQVPLEAMASNIHDGNLPAIQSFVEINNEWIVLTAIKPGTQMSTAIVRGYNSTSSEQPVQFFFSMSLKNITRTNILEHAIQEISFNSIENSCEFVLSPNEVFTLLVEFSLR